MQSRNALSETKVSNMNRPHELQISLQQIEAYLPREKSRRPVANDGLVLLLARETSAQIASSWTVVFPRPARGASWARAIQRTNS